MSGFMVRWPDGFVPEEHGWELSVPAGDGPPCWLRWQIPFLFPAAISQCLYDEATGTVGGWYMPASGTGPEEMTLREIHAEMLGDLSFELSNVEDLT